MQRTVIYSLKQAPKFDQHRITRPCLPQSVGFRAQSLSLGGLDLRPYHAPILEQLQRETVGVSGSTLSTWMTASVASLCRRGLLTCHMRRKCHSPIGVARLANDPAGEGLPTHGVGAGIPGLRCIPGYSFVGVIFRTLC